MTRPILLLLAALLAGFTGSGCYYAQLVAGQGDIIFSSKPVDDAIADSERRIKRLQKMQGIPEDQKLRVAYEVAALRDTIRKLRLVTEARAFAHDELGLVRNDNYSVYFDTGGRHRYPTFVVTAASKSKLVPVLFTFPIVGALPYKGFFVRRQAEELTQQLLDAGYDAYMGPTSAFSTLGFFVDPVFSPMLNRDGVELSALIFHELLHATVYHPKDSNFNESLATFFERRGAVYFLEQRLGADHPAVATTRQRYADKDRFSSLVEGMRDELKALFDSDRSDEEKVILRESVFQRWQDFYVAERMAGRIGGSGNDWFVSRRLDNALVLSLVRYIAGLSLYDAVWKSLDRDFTLSIPVFRAAAEADDPRGYLADWLRERGLEVPDDDAGPSDPD